jgi:hypothetical protein
VRVSHVLILVILAALAMDFVVLSGGAFRFDTDESMVGIRTDARDAVAAPARPDAGVPSARVATDVTARPASRRQPAEVARPDGPSARSRLVLASASDRSSDDH